MMTKDEMTALLRSVGSNENTITAMCNAFDIGAEYAQSAPSRETLLAEVAVLTELVRVLSDKVAGMEANQLELPQPKLTGKFSISAGKFKCTGCTGAWTNREDAKHHLCKNYQ